MTDTVGCPRLFMLDIADKVERIVRLTLLMCLCHTAMVLTIGVYSYSITRRKLFDRMPYE